VIAGEALMAVGLALLTVAGLGLPALGLSAAGQLIFSLLAAGLSILAFYLGVRPGSR
jgi:hypothetical protein